MDAITGENEKGACIAALREELGKNHTVRLFSTPEELVLQVTLAILDHLALARPKKFDLPEKLTEKQDLQQFGSSLLPEIEEQVKKAAADIKGTNCIEVNLLQGNYWWSTRLYLLACLAADLTQIRCIVFVDGEGRFVGMASPAEVRRALWAAQWFLQQLYVPVLGPFDPDTPPWSQPLGIFVKRSRMPATRNWT